MVSKAIGKSRRTRPTRLPKYDKFRFERLFDKVRDIGRQRITLAGSFCRLTLYIDGSDSECFGSHHRWQARALARLQLIFRTRPKAYRVDQKCHRETQTHVHLNDATRRKPGPMSRSTLHLERIRAISRVARQLRCVHPLSFLLFYIFLLFIIPFYRLSSHSAEFSHVSPISRTSRQFFPRFAYHSKSFAIFLCACHRFPWNSNDFSYVFRMFATIFLV